MRIIVKGGKIIDPANGRKGESLDILLVDGKIARIGMNFPLDKAKVIDARGLFVTPGLFDIHTHFRDPGQERKETIQTGSRAAAKGGFTSVATMANTEPAADSPQIIGYMLDRARRDGVVNVFPIGCVTLGMRGEELTNISELIDAGVVALSDDGKPVKNPEIMKLALARSREYGIPVITHSEVITEDCVGWAMNRGETSAKLGLIGLPNSAEETMIERDIALAQETGGHLHVAHVSTAGSVELVRRAKEKGINVTAEATPHHFSLTDAAVEEYGANAKMSPPLRSQADVEAVIAGLSDGTIDAIVTDHAPHTSEEKALGIESAPCGIVGLETCVPLVFTKLIFQNHLTISEAIAKMTMNPSRIMNLDKGTLSEGADADITIIDTQKEQAVDASKFESKGRNTPFSGWKLKGWPAMTIVGGNVVFPKGYKLEGSE